MCNSQNTHTQLCTCVSAAEIRSPLPLQLPVLAASLSQPHPHPAFLSGKQEEAAVHDGFCFWSSCSTPGTVPGTISFNPCHPPLRVETLGPILRIGKQKVQQGRATLPWSCCSHSSQILPHAFFECPSRLPPQDLCTGSSFHLDTFPQDAYMAFLVSSAQMSSFQKGPL